MWKIKAALRKTKKALSMWGTLWRRKNRPLGRSGRLCEGPVGCGVVGEGLKTVGRRGGGGSGGR
jgi:hypothetical protein